MQYIDQRRLEKRLAIINATLQTAASIRQVLNNSGGVLRKKPRFVNKHLYAHKARLNRKRVIALTTAQLAISAAMGAAHIHMIIAQPIPKFPPGSSSFKGENEKEIISTNGNKTCE